MRIGIVMPLAEQRGGGEQTLLDLIQHGRNVDIDWYVIFLEDGPMVEQIKTLGVAVAVFPCGRLREPHRFIQTITAIAAFSNQNQLDRPTPPTAWRCSRAGRRARSWAPRRGSSTRPRRPGWPR